MKRRNRGRIYPRREFLAAATGFGLALVSGRSGVKAQTRASDRNIKPGTYDWSLEHGGLTRTYRIHIPTAYKPTKPAPLVLAFHGGGGRGQGAEKLSGLTDVSIAESSRPKKPVAVIDFHGTKDEHNYWEGGGRAGGKTLSVSALIQWWVERNACPRSPKTESLPDKEDDGTKVKRETYGPGKDGVEVVLYTIEGGGHTWPGGWQYYLEERIGKTSRDINASELMWEFFAKHRRSAR